MTTFAGKLLRIDLGSFTSTIEQIPELYFSDFISARGLAAKYLFDELKPNIDPLGPGNKLILSVGVLAGTGLQGFSKWAVSTKSPLTGTIFRSVVGGNFGAWMKHAGYDLIIIQGSAKNLVTVHVDTSGVYFSDAKEFSGIDPRGLQKLLKKKYGRRTESACIGIAGENLIRYASITSGERTASRGGVGTVMGAKNLKAISINVPVKKPVPFDNPRFQDLVKKQISMLKDHPRKKNMTTLGTPYITTVLDKMGILPVKNFQEGSIPGIDKVSGKKFYDLKMAKAGCYLCMTRCGGMRNVTEGPFGGTQIDGPEYESIYAFGPLLDITDSAFVTDANAFCDYYGLDTISTGVSIAFAFELFEKGIISAVDTNGLDLTWGNKKAIFSLIEMIGKKEGIGALLGQGVKRAARDLGGEAGIYAMEIKGLELAGYDPRGVKGYALSMATSNIGGSHMYGRPREELSGIKDPFTETDKGLPIAQVQKEQALDDSLIACTFGNSGLSFEMYAEYLAAATGNKEFENVNNFIKIGERIVCIERCFNVREGFARKDDSLPKRMTTEPLRKAGPSTGQMIRNLDKLLDEYYEALGYGKNGIPKPGKLRELGLDGTIKNLS
ncbi:MAG: aldehyde ferredoxin oxidoreductase family protein [Deltaproteobacteria bacterium]|nr:aldehyde ferredoxin oxidoreductase family protein [Deltaproteobacteria bacterium]